MLMKKIIIVGIIIAVILIGSIVILSNDKKTSVTKAFHVTLADPKKYVNGKFEQSFELDEGQYRFHFVPNGDSPKILSIILDGDGYHFSEDFKLVGTPHTSDVAEYYTWDYDGQKEITISQNIQVKISIDPHQDILGPVSVDIIKE